MIAMPVIGTTTVIIRTSRSTTSKASIIWDIPCNPIHYFISHMHVLNCSKDVLVFDYLVP
jgi:hypothetical protein